jgi:hypothetical protein
MESQACLSPCPSREAPSGDLSQQAGPASKGGGVWDVKAARRQQVSHNLELQVLHQLL